MPECLVVSNTNKNYMFLSLGDGRIVRSYYNKEEELQWETLIHTGEHNVDCGKGGPTDTNDAEERCGRPLGMIIVNKSSVMDVDVSSETTKDDVLIVADAYKGLLFISGIYTAHPEILSSYTSQSLTSLSRSFKLLNGVAAAPDGSIYFTETSSEFDRRRIFHAAFDGHATGVLYRYTKGRGIEVAARDIYMPNGLTVSHDGEYLLIVTGVQILRYSLKKLEMESVPFANMPGTGDNILAHDHLPNGAAVKCYWAALGSKFAMPFSLLKALSDKPLLKSLLVALVPYKMIVDAIPKLSALAVYGENGTLLDVYQDTEASVPWVSEAVRFGEYLYIGSWYNEFLGRVKVSDLISDENEV